MSAPAIRVRNVSKFYGEVLGCNRVDLEIPPGITSLVGPNGSGKSTLMNLIAGLLRPTRGTIDVLGLSPEKPELLFRRLGYCTQFDSFPRGVTGRSFLEGMLLLHGRGVRWARDTAAAAIEAAGMTADAARSIASYSKGMRQRIKLAQAIAHDPEVLILDEPLNGLDPMARAEAIELFRGVAARPGRFVVISSHILHEVDMVSDRVVLLKGGYVVAEGGIDSVREEVKDHPSQVLVRCDRPSLLAARLFSSDHLVEARIQEDGALLVRTTNADLLHLLVNRVVREEGLRIESIAPADSDVQAVYRYLIEGEGAT